MRQTLFEAVGEREICDEYQQGTSAELIAQAHFVARSTVLAVLRKRGITIRPRGRSRQLVSDQLLEPFRRRYAEGQSMRSLSMQSGVPRSTLRRLLAA